MTHATPALPRELLTGALQQDASRPLLTFYDDLSGERVELSVTTFANWVAKTANFLRDGLGAGAGQQVTIRLPAHWQSAVWLSACWASGAVPVTGRADARADVAVVAADDALPPPPADELVVLGLGPLGLPRSGQRDRSLAAVHGAGDYDREIHSHGDHFIPASVGAPDDLALVVEGNELSGRTLASETVRAQQLWQLHPGDRVLGTAPLDTLPAILAMLLVPLAGNGGAVLCRHPDVSRLAARVQAERVVGLLRTPGLAVGLPSDLVPLFLGDLGRA